MTATLSVPNVEVRLYRNDLPSVREFPIHMELETESSHQIALICDADAYRRHVNSGRIGFDDRDDGYLSLHVKSAEAGYAFLRELTEELPEIRLGSSASMLRDEMQKIITEMEKVR